MRFSLLAIIALSAAGCASKPVMPDEAKPVQPSEIQAPDLDTGEPVTVIRDQGFYGGACRIQFLVDGRPAAKIYTSERFDFRLPVGEYDFEAQSTGMCGGNGTVYQAEIGEGLNIYRINYSGQAIQIKPHYPAMNTAD